MTVPFEQKALELFVEGGGTVHDPSAEERATFMTAREPVMDWYAAEYGAAGQRWLDTFVKFADETR